MPVEFELNCSNSITSLGLKGASIRRLKFYIYTLHSANPKTLHDFRNSRFINTFSLTSLSLYALWWIYDNVCNNIHLNVYTQKPPSSFHKQKGRLNEVAKK